MGQVKEAYLNNYNYPPQYEELSLDFEYTPQRQEVYSNITDISTQKEA